MAETEKHAFVSAECGVTFIALFFPHLLVNSTPPYFMEEERGYFPNLEELICHVEA